VFERFSERARQAVVYAQEEARVLKHNYVGTEHLLLGLLREEEGLAARVLESLDVTFEEVRAQVVRIVGEGERTTYGQIPFTPRAKKTLELSLRVARSFDHKNIDTEHVLLALVEEREGLAAQTLDEFDVDREAIGRELSRLAGWTAYVSPERERPIRFKREDVVILRKRVPTLVAAASTGAAIFAAGLLVGWLIWG
jgi:ATP-dependent Clp protease ATP-binding subunit ClpC